MLKKSQNDQRVAKHTTKVMLHIEGKYIRKHVPILGNPEGDNCQKTEWDEQAQHY